MTGRKMKRKEKVRKKKWRREKSVEENGEE